MSVDTMSVEERSLDRWGPLWAEGNADVNNEMSIGDNNAHFLLILCIKSKLASEGPFTLMGLFFFTAGAVIFFADATCFRAVLRGVFVTLTFLSESEVPFLALPAHIKAYLHVQFQSAISQ
jgi:hypothetical protein